MKTKMYTAQRLAGFIAESRFDDLPQEVVHQIKLCILDSIGCTLGGYRTDVGQIVTGTIKYLGGNPQSVIIGSGERTSCTYAAFANATMANILDYDDTMLFVSHPGATIVLPAIAVGETTKASGRDIIVAISAGYEVFTRIALAIKPSTEREQQVWGFGPPFGAATVASKLLKLTEDEVVNALGIAGANAPVPSVRKTVLGQLGPANTVKNNYGCAAEVGILSTLLAQKGFVGPPDILDGDDGFWRIYGSDQCDFERMTEGLGQKYMVMDNSFKPYPSCRATHSAIGCAAAILQEHKSDFKAIDRIVVSTRSRWSKVPFRDAEPKTMFEAQFSVPYVVALTLMGVEPGPDWYAESAMTDPEVLELARKVELRADPECDQLEEPKLLAKMEVVAKGARYSCRVEPPKGDPDNPLTGKELETKFKSLAHKVISEGKADKVIQLVGRLERLDDISELTQLLF